ncbi:MAG: hypothetical protein AAFO80_03040 [Pseudomonadota bacterium]
MPNERIATCCYCGTRAALVLRGRDRHELACSTCGAPLHNLKMLKADHPGQRALVKPSRARKPAPQPDWTHQDRKKERRRPKKRRKSLGRKFLEEAWDLVEDIID